MRKKKRIMPSTNPDRYFFYRCEDCNKVFRSRPKAGECTVCKGELEKISRVKICELEGCGREFYGGHNRRYCVDHTALSKEAKEREIQRLLKLKDRGN